MAPARETSKPCAPFLSRIRFTWYRNTTAESRGAVSRHFSVSAPTSGAEPVPSSNERVHTTSCVFLPLLPSLSLSLLPFDDFSRSPRSRFSWISCSSVVAPTRSLASAPRSIFPFRFNETIPRIFVDSFFWNFSNFKIRIQILRSFFCFCLEGGLDIFYNFLSSFLNGF